MATQPLLDTVQQAFQSPQAIFDIIYAATKDSRFRAQVEFFVRCWELVTTVENSSRTNDSLGRLLNNKQNQHLLVKDNQPWRNKVAQMNEAIEEDKRSVSASVKRRFIKDAEVVERAFGKKYEERFTQLVNPAYLCTSKYSYLRVLVAFFKVMPGHEEQAFSPQQLTQHLNAVSPGSKRALGEPVRPDPKKQRLGGVDHLTRSVQDGSMPQVRCTVEGSPLSQETTYIPNNILPPNQTPSHEELNKLQYYREIPIPDTNDITVVYRWGGGPALRTMREGCSFNRDQEEREWYWAYIVLDLLPFSFLKEFIKQSDVWKEENRESSETQCVQLCMYQRPESAYCYLYCIVPKAVVSECRGSYDTDPAPL